MVTSLNSPVDSVGKSGTGWQIASHSNSPRKSLTRELGGLPLELCDDVCEVSSEPLLRRAENVHHDNHGEHQEDGDGISAPAPLAGNADEEGFLLHGDISESFKR